jgi:uncharacterized protein (DUF433 family)
MLAMTSPQPFHRPEPWCRLTWEWSGSTMADQLSRITLNPEVCHGKPTIRGLRYPVEMLLDLLASGMSSVEILADYPDLEAEDITAALQYAAQLARVQRVELLPA